MKAVILAAGVGSRLRPLTDNLPKSLLMVGGKTILERMVQNILDCEIREVAVVTGYMADTIKQYLQKTFPELSITYISNNNYENTNTGYSLLLARDFTLNSSFVKFDADVIFEIDILKKLIESTHETSLSIDTNIHLELEEVKVIVDNDNKVLQVGKKVDVNKAQGESIGIEKISKSAAVILFAELEKLMQDQKNWKEYYDDSYTTLVQKGVPFYALDITGKKWVEVDTHKDFVKANQLFNN